MPFRSPAWPWLLLSPPCNNITPCMREGREKKGKEGESWPAQKRSLSSLLAKKAGMSSAIMQGSLPSLSLFGAAERRGGKKKPAIELSLAIAPHSLDFAAEEEGEEEKGLLMRECVR